MDTDTRREEFEQIVNKLDDGGYEYMDMFPVVGATYLTRKWKGNPLWLISIGPPGSGKTISLDLFECLDDVIIGGDITPAGLITAFDCRGEDPSLFLQLEGGKLLLAPDFSSIMEANYEEKASIFKMFRRAFDGYVDKKFSHVHREYKPKFNFVAAATESADQDRDISQQLGERFIRYRTHPPTLPWPLEEINPAVHTEVARWMIRLENADETPEPDSERWIGEVGDTVARLRTEVTHKGGTDEIMHINRFERPTRLCKQFSKLYRGLYAITGDESMARRIVKQTALESVPPARVNVLRYIHENPDCTQPEVSDELHLGRRVIRTLTKDMQALGVLRLERKWEREDEYERAIGLHVTEEYRKRGDGLVWDLGESDE